MIHRKRLPVASVLLCVTLTAPVLADPPSGQDGGGRGRGEQHPAQGNQGGDRQQADRGQARPDQHGNPGSNASARANDHSAAAVARSDQNRQPATRPQTENQGNVARQHIDQPVPARERVDQNQQRHTSGNPTQARSAVRPENIQKLRRNMQADRHFRAGSYQAPQGYAQRRWGYGDRLPNAYFARNYWISNYLLFSLFAPPSGLVWVRVGYDAFLIDRYDGEIIQTRYGIFY